MADLTTAVKKTIHKANNMDSAISTLNSYSQAENYLFGYIEERKKGIDITIITKTEGVIKRQVRAHVLTTEVPHE
jgi:hypothetical protein